MQNGHHLDRPYMLATGEKAISRLGLLERIFGPATRHLLSTAGLSSGMHVTEIGCGIGLTARWVSTQVSPGGSVVGVDSSSEQLHIAMIRVARNQTGLPRCRDGVRCASCAVTNL